MMRKRIKFLLFASFMMLFLGGCEKNELTLDCPSEMEVEVYRDVDVLSLCTVTSSLDDYKISEANFTVQKPVSFDTIGSETIIVSYDDENQHVETTINVNVVDKEAPSIDVVGYILFDGYHKIDVNEYIRDIDDNYDADEELVLTYDYTNIDYYKIGNYPLIITVTDTSLNERSYTVTVEIMQPYHGVILDAAFDWSVDGALVTLDIRPEITFKTLTYTIQTYDEAVEGNWKNVEGLINIPFEGTTFELNNLEIDNSYRAVINYIVDDSVKTEESFTSDVNHYPAVFEYDNPNKFTIYTTWVDVIQYLDRTYRADVVRVDIVNKTTSETVQSFTGYPGDYFKIENLTDNTTYNLVYVFENKSFSYEFTTLAKEVGDDFTFSFHFRQEDNDYTNSGIGLYINETWEYYPVTSVDDFGGVVTIITNETALLVTEETPLKFYRNLATLDELKTDFNDSIDPLLMRERVVLTGEFYYFEGEDHVYTKYNDNYLIFMFYTAEKFNVGDISYYSYESDFTNIESLNHQLAMPLAIETTQVIDGIETPVYFAIIELENKTNSKTYFEILGLNHISYHVVFENNLPSDSNFQILYYTPEMTEPTEDNDVFIEKIQTERLIFDYFDLTNITVQNVNSLVVTINFNSSMTLLDFTKTISITIKDSTNQELSQIPAVNAECDSNYLYISVVPFNAHSFGLVGDFNDWDYNHPVEFYFTYQNYFLICTDEAGSYQVLYDEDDNGFTEDDLYSDTVYNYDFTSGSTTYYQLDIIDNNLELVPFESASYAVVFTPSTVENTSYDVYITFTIEGTEYLIIFPDSPLNKPSYRPFVIY